MRPILMFLFVALLTLPSCKKGCTDTKAYNYSAGAKDDDASCLYCDSIVKEIPTTSSSTRYYIDYYSGSAYYQQSVISIRTVGALKQYVGNGCKRMGLGDGSGCNQISVTAEVTNLTSKTIIITGSSFISGRTKSQEFDFDHVSISPYGTITLEAGSICDVSTVYSFFLQSNSGVQVFQYR